MKIATAFIFLAAVLTTNANSLHVSRLSGPSFGAGRPVLQAHPITQPQLEGVENQPEEQNDAQSERERLRDLIAQTVLKNERPNMQQPEQQLESVSEPKRPQRHPKPIKITETEPEPILNNGQFDSLFEQHRPIGQPEIGSAVIPQVDSESKTAWNLELQPIRKPWQTRPIEMSKPEFKPETETDPEGVRRPWYQSILLALRQQHGHSKQLVDGSEKKVQGAELANSDAEQEIEFVKAFAQPSPYFVVPNFHH